MNSTFKNSRLGTYLYIFLIATVVTVTILIFWFMLAGYRIGTYSEDTILGSVYLGGLHEGEVNAKMEDKYVDWLNDDSIVYELTYQGYDYPFNRELFSFNIELSMERLIDGKTNELVVEYQQSGTDRQDVEAEIRALPFLSDVIDNVDVEALINDILADAGMMKTYSLKRVEDYLITEGASDVVINTYAISLPSNFDGHALMTNINDTYGSNLLPVESKELYDFADELGDELSDIDMSLLSKCILELSLYTNFSIHEVYYESSIDFGLYDIASFPYKGNNSFINTPTGKSFSFYNPNNSDYAFEVEYLSETHELQVSLVGLPFVNTVNVIKQETIIEHAIRYSSTVEPSIGYDGLIVNVYREIINLEDDTISYDEVHFEFYPPIIEYQDNNNG